MACFASRARAAAPAKEACRRHHADGVTVVIFGGPVDEHFGLPLVTDWVGRASIRQTMALAALCDVAAVVDSSVVHIALALGKPPRPPLVWCDQQSAGLHPAPAGAPAN